MILKFLHEQLHKKYKWSNYAMNWLEKFVPYRGSTKFSLLRELQLAATATSTSWALDNLRYARMFPGKHQLLLDALSKLKQSPTVFEFGVYRGFSVNLMGRKRRDAKIFGFDSFRGLNEDFSGTLYKKGDFDLKGRCPRVKPNVNLVVGSFENTIPEFIRANQVVADLVHIDCDTYESSHLVLIQLIDAGVIAEGTILVFDEFYNFPFWQWGEFLAFNETVAREFSYRFISYSEESVGVVIERKLRS
jgi:hypothetical protein